MTQACIKENFPTSSNEVTEGEEVTLSMSVTVPGMEVATRALGEYDKQYANSHPSLWVVVFDQQGYLVEYAKATDPSLTGGSLNETKFSVKLHETPEPCIIHYLLNYTDDLELAFGHESSLIGGLVVGPDQDVYWQRRVLQGGINDDPTYISNNFTKIPLVRNFAKITVTVDKKVNNFTLSGFYVLNCPNTGTVAPYSNGAFVNYQPALEEDQSLYDVLTGAGYVGNEPDGLEFNNTAAPAAGDFSTAATYLYENTAEDKNAVTTILIAGKFDSDDDKAFDDETVTYYKADLVTNDLVSGGTKYAHILRNFHYELNITSVIASGKDIEGAMNAAANNNLSGAVEIKDLTNVTNGTAGIYVSFTDTTLVSTNPIVLKYKFLTNVSDKTSYSNDRVKISAKSGDVVRSTAKGSLITTPTTSSWYGYQELIINPQELPDYTKEQTIVLYDEATKLRREVVIRLRKKLDMEVTCNPKVVDAAVGQSMTLNIKLDTTLNKALFPLDFTIESQTNESSSTLKQYISPASSEVISVQTGKSIVPGYSNSKSYQYIKTLSHDDYTVLKNTAKQNDVDYVILPVAFKTNIANNASTVYVRNLYFNDASDYFVNESEVLVDGGFYGAGNEVKLMFLAEAAGDYTITSSVLAETKAVNNTIALAAGEVYEKTLYTSTWSDRVAVTITGPSYNTTLSGVEKRNKLAMKATSIKVGTSDLSTFQEFGIYTTENAAKSMTGSIGTATTSDLKSAAGALLVRENLTQTTDLYFSYTDGSYVYVASAKANALHAGAALTFAQHEIPLSMQIEFGDGADRYGSGQAFTLTFTTNKTGTYEINSMNFAIENVSTNAEFEMTAGVPVTVNCTSTTWSDKATIIIQCNETVTGTNPQTFTGPDRDKLVIPAKNILAYNSSQNFSSDGNIQIFTTDPGKSYNVTPLLEYSYTRQSNNKKFAYNTDSISVTLQSDVEKIFIRYYNNNYYVGSVDVQDIYKTQTQVELKRQY